MNHFHAKNWKQFFSPLTFNPRKGVKKCYVSKNSYRDRHCSPSWTIFTQKIRNNFFRPYFWHPFSRGSFHPPPIKKIRWSSRLCVLWYSIRIYFFWIWHLPRFPCKLTFIVGGKCLTVRWGPARISNFVGMKTIFTSDFTSKHSVWYI